MDRIEPKPTEPGSTPVEEELAHLDGIANLMDRAFRIPGTQLRVGLDSIVGLVPGVGDTLALLPAAYIVYTARRLGMPGHIVARMAANTAIDTVIGSIPLIGDIFDVGFKSNTRNVALLRRELAARK